MRRWWRRLFAAPPPSSYLFRHLNGAGGGFSLDDLVTGRAGDPAYQDVIDAIMLMIARHGDPALASPAARTELRRLAMNLATQGR